MSEIVAELKIKYSKETGEQEDHETDEMQSLILHKYDTPEYNILVRSRDGIREKLSRYINSEEILDKITSNEFKDRIND